jgi:hypothetical protein
MTTYNYIYLLQEREFVNSKESIYKIGKTKRENLTRFHQYPKNSLLLLQLQCLDNCDNIEKKIIESFKSKYKQRTDIGREYFEGNYQLMMIDICFDFFHSVVSNKDEKNNVVTFKTINEEQNKIYNDFFDDCIIINYKKSINRNDLNEEFCNWLFKKHKLINKWQMIDLYNEIDKKFTPYDITNKLWFGIELLYNYGENDKFEIIFNNFVKQRITIDKKGKITRGDISCEFCSWYEENYGKRDKPNIKDIYAEIDKKFGKYDENRKGWIGFRMTYDSIVDEKIDKIEDSIVN